MKVFGAEGEDRLWAAAVATPAVVSHRVSCFFLLSTLRRDMDSEDSLLRTEQIRTITRTWRQTGSGLDFGLQQLTCPGLQQGILGDSEASHLPHPRCVLDLCHCSEEAWWHGGRGQLQGPAEAPGVQQRPWGLAGRGGGARLGLLPAGQTELLSRPEDPNTKIDTVRPP